VIIRIQVHRQDACYLRGSATPLCRKTSHPDKRVSGPNGTDSPISPEDAIYGIRAFDKRNTLATHWQVASLPEEAEQWMGTLKEGVTDTFRGASVPQIDDQFVY